MKGIPHSEVNPRTVEIHEGLPGGGLPNREHFDGGSLITIDIMLGASEEFEGGQFRTLECDGTMKTIEFDQGDALVFMSHKMHCVEVIKRGRRKVLVMEFWVSHLLSFEVI